MATLSTNNNFLETLARASSDAQGNLFLISISGGAFTDSITQALKVRCDNFTSPRKNQGKYDVRFLTEKIQRPSAKTEVTRNFSISFRVDANLVAYKAVLEQQAKTFKPTKSFTLVDIYEMSQKGQLFSVTVEAVDEGLLDTTPSSRKLFKFKNCWISQVTPLGFNNASSNPISVTVTINFIEMEDLQTGIA